MSADRSASGQDTVEVARVAIQGEHGSFSHEAALDMVPGAAIVPCPLSAEVFSRLTDGSVDAAVIPIENSLAGSVVEHYDLLFAHDVRIAEEALLRIRHTLIAAPGSRIEDVRRVYSHPVALAQCRDFFKTHPQAAPSPFYDTAGSVQYIMAQPEAGSAAIASREAARVYGAAVLLEGIEDNPENYTRFFRVVRSHPTSGQAGAAGPGKVSLAFAVDNRPGTLVAALQVFADLGTNLTRLESRPIPFQPWHYIFYADYEVAAGQPAFDAAALLAPHCSIVKELGRYRPAVPRS
jgi:prephenate dehydratase